MPEGYREFAYISNGGSNTVSVLDLVYLRQDRTLQVGTNPTNLAANPVRNEVYVVNNQSGTLSVIDADANRVAATIPVHHLPSFVAVDPTGHRTYVANSGSNSVFVPRPVHSGQAPYGELKENMRGSRSGIENPHTGRE